MKNPPKDKITADAILTIDLLELLSRSPDFNADNISLIRPATLRHVFGFIQTTWTDYFSFILPPKLVTDLSCRARRDPSRREEAYAKFAELEANPDADFDRNRWPDYDQEKYTDALGRNFMAASIIKDPAKQRMFGGVYAFSDEVRAVAEKMLGC